MCIRDRAKVELQNCIAKLGNQGKLVQMQLEQLAGASMELSLIHISQASMRAMLPGEFGSIVYTSDQPWMNVNYLILFAAIAIVLVLSALVVYLIESRNPRT